MLGNFSRFCCRLLRFFLLSSVELFKKNNYFQKEIQDHYQCQNSLDPDQDGSFIGPDLGPNCLQRLSADDSHC